MSENEDIVKKYSILETHGITLPTWVWYRRLRNHEADWWLESCPEDDHWDTLAKEGKTQKVIAKEPACSQCSLSNTINDKMNGRGKCWKGCTQNSVNHKIERTNERQIVYVLCFITNIIIYRHFTWIWLHLNFLVTLNWPSVALWQCWGTKYPSVKLV